MNKIDRRTALLLSSAAVAAPAMSLAQSSGPEIALPVEGKLRTRRSSEIAASPLSVGMETLDRKMFEPERTYGILAQLGVKWARLQTGWARTERTKGQYDFVWLDEVVDSLLKIGIQPWFNLGYGNRLYTPEAPHETAVGYVPLGTPEARAAWLEYVGRLAEHFRGRVRHWEMWNEANINGFWRPNEANPKSYAELVALTAPVIRKRIPDVVIVGFALAGFGGPFDFVKGALDCGIAEHIDRFSYHPYQLIPEANYVDAVHCLRRLLAKYKPGVELWQGENGAPSFIGGAGHVFEVDGTEAGQAKWLLRRILTDLSVDVELTSYFHLCDLAKYVWSNGPSGQTQKMGLLRTDYTPKQSFFAYQNLCALFDAQSKRADQMAIFRGAKKEGTKGSPGLIEGIWRTAFLRGKYALYAYWWPGNLSRPARHDDVSVALWPEGELTAPVLVDPLSGQVYTLTTSRSRGFVNVPKLPLREYPLIITDRAALPA
ncbi:MAG: beta-galactosidase [Bryobacteraceae bacterium]